MKLKKNQMKLKQKFVKAHMETAWIYSKLSHCKRLKVGAVLVKNNNPIAIGYNGRPSGEPNIGETEDGLTHPDVRHAEVNALKKVTRSTESSADSAMFVTHAPCRQCAIDMVDAGVLAVFYGEPYRDDSGVKYLLRHNVKVYEIENNGRIFELVRDKYVESEYQKCYRSPDRYPEILF